MAKLTIYDLGYRICDFTGSEADEREKIKN